jgi:hypothetical protein
MLGSLVTDVSESVAVLLARFGSITLTGTLTAAVFVSVPTAKVEVLAVAVYARLEPAGKFTVSLILPEPFADPQVAPPDTVAQVQLTEVI